MGLIASIYRHYDQDTTRNGLSARYNNVTLPELSGPFDEDANRPSVKVVYRDYLNYYHVEPCIPDVPLKKWLEKYTRWMAGGNFVYSLDNRFRSKFNYPLSLHDRTESRINPFIVQDIFKMDDDACFDILHTIGTCIPKLYDESEYRRLKVRILSFYVRHNMAYEFVNLSMLLRAYRKSISPHLHRQPKFYQLGNGSYVCAITNELTTETFAGTASTKREAYKLAYAKLREFSR